MMSDGKLLFLFRDPCTDRDVEQRVKDSELIDFFQHSPIYFIGCLGKSLFCGQTKRNVTS
jgi:hypothetical protein